MTEEDALVRQAILDHLDAQKATLVGRAWDLGESLDRQAVVDWVFGVMEGVAARLYLQALGADTYTLLEEDHE